MIDDLESKYKRLRAENDTLNARIEVAKENLKSLTDELTQKFKCSSIEDAEALLKKLEAAKDKLEKKIRESLASI